MGDRCRRMMMFECTCHISRLRRVVGQWLNRLFLVIELMGWIWSRGLYHIELEKAKISYFLQGESARDQLDSKS
jgi:hypothetical protein